MKKLEGVIPALLTPFAPNGSVDLATLTKLIQFLVPTGVCGLYVNGSTAVSSLPNPLLNFPPKSSLLSKTVLHRWRPKSLANRLIGQFESLPSKYNVRSKTGIKVLFFAAQRLEFESDRCGLGNAVEA